MANPNGTPESLGVTPLAKGEHSRPIRIRAPAWVFDALAQRSAAEVGQLLATALRDSGGQIVAPLETVLHALDKALDPLEAIPPPQTTQTALRGSLVISTRQTSGLSSTLLSIVDSLKGDGVAEFDRRERKWMVTERSGTYAVYKRDLGKLVKAGLIQEKNGQYRAK